MIPRLLLLLAAAIAAGISSGCDNPACVFAGTCRDLDGGGGGAGGLSAEGGRPPEEGQLMTPGAPLFLSSSPEIADARPRTPLFFQFSESLDPSTIRGAFLVLDVFVGIPVPVEPVLVGDGRVIVVLGAWEVGRQYEVVWSPEQDIRDLNGQSFVADFDFPILNFSVSDDETVEPRVIFSYPNDGSTTDSDTSEIVIGFDRPMDDSTFDETSFVVTVDGVDPAMDPDPEPLLPAGVAGFGEQTQVWRWRPIDASDRVRSYGPDASVVVELSPVSAPILSEDGDALPLTETMFQTLEFSAPTQVTRPAGSLLLDGFGRADVFGSGVPLLEVTLAEPAVSGLSAEVYLFGTSPSNAELQRSLVRTVDVTQGVSSFTISSDSLDLTDGVGDAQFADGSVSLSVQLRRGSVRTGTRILDGDPSTDILDGAFFDTTAPTLLGLGSDGMGVDGFSSRLGDFVAVGRASEPISYAFVDAGLDGNNGGSVTEPPETAFARSVGSDGEAIFVCAPVAVGQLDSNGAAVSYEITVYDRVLNASTVTAIGTFDQRGLVGPGGAPTGGNVRVRVLNALSLEPVNGALVFSHGESGGAVTFVATATSGADGRATVAGAAVDDTLISVDAAGFDLVTFHGVPRDAIDIMVTPSGLAPAGSSGAVQAEAAAALSLIQTNVVADTRAVRGLRLSDVEMCGADASMTGISCDFETIRIRPDALGAASLIGTNEALPQAAFNPVQYWQAFAIAAPLPAQSSGSEDFEADIEVGSGLNLTLPDDQPLLLTPQGLTIAGLSNLGNLDGQPLTTVEAEAAGMDGPLVVGRASSYVLTATSWTLLGASAGVAGPAGPLVSRGAIKADLYLRSAVRDTAGNEVAARPLLSAVAGLLAPIDVPRVLSPGPGGSSGGSAFNLTVSDTLPDSAGVDGVVKVVLGDTAGRQWEIFGLDTSDAAGDYLLSVPDLTANGGTSLEDGALSAEVTLYGVPFDRGHFLYSELELRHTLYGYAAPITFQQP